MAEPEQMIVVCDKCGARLKLKPIQIKILNEVKCGKCGNRIPTANAVPMGAAQPGSAEPISVVMSRPASAPPEPTPPADEPAPVMVPPVASAPAPVVPADPVRTPTPPPPSRTQTIKSRTANFGPAPMDPNSDSPPVLKRKIQELEDEVKVFRQQIFTLEDQIARQVQESARFQELLQRAADAEDRATELQELWYQKEKDSHALEERLRHTEDERDESLAVRESILNNIKDLLATYHSTEMEAARKRLTDLDDRMDRFVSLIRQRNAPPATPPPEPIAEARQHDVGG